MALGDATWAWSLSINLPTIKWHYFSGHTGDPPAITLSSRQHLCLIISFLSLSFPSHPHSNKSSSSLKLHVQQLDRWFVNTLLLIMAVKEGTLKPVNACFFSLMCVPSFCLAPADYSWLPVTTAWYFSGDSEMPLSPSWNGHLQLLWGCYCCQSSSWLEQQLRILWAQQPGPRAGMGQEGWGAQGQRREKGKGCEGLA